MVRSLGVHLLMLSQFLESREIIPTVVALASPKWGAKSTGVKLYGVFLPSVVK